jgi:DNA-binding transcriptional regulator YhcF (GntR family)
MILRVDAASPTPPFEQLRAQIASMVRDGALPAGTRLPTIRGLAEDLELAPATVARAYRELEDGGFVVTRGRHGTFVVDDTSGRVSTARERQARLEAAAAAFAREALQIGAAANDAVDHVRRALSRLSSASES